MSDPSRHLPRPVDIPDPLAPAPPSVSSSAPAPVPKPQSSPPDDSEEAASKAGGGTMGSINRETVSTWVRWPAKELPISQLQWDLDGSQGQVRLLDEDKVLERKKSLLEAVPEDLINVTVWTMNTVGVKPLLCWSYTGCLGFDGVHAHVPFAHVRVVVHAFDLPLDR